MARASLNIDILAIICNFLTDVPDVISFGLTCSALRFLAVQRLLSMRPVALAGGPSVRRFHCFLFADLVARAPYVHALDIETGPRPKEAVDNSEDVASLMEILVSLPQLESILVNLEDGSHRCTDDQRIVDTIATLPTLRSLSLCGWSKDVPRLLSHVRGPLRRLVIDCTHPVGVFWYPAALEEVLPHLAPTLEELELGYFVLDPRKLLASGVSTSTPIDRMHQYINVHSLTIGSILGPPLLERLQHLFPGLNRKLSLGILDTDIPERAYANIRSSNQRAQKEGKPDDSCWWRKQIGRAHV